MKRKYQIQISQPTAGGRRSASSGMGHRSRRNGSALILAVVLTTLLATVGVLFVLLSRIDKMAASAASQNRELSFAIDTVVAKISQKLVLDVPGVDPNVNVDYYDYPGPQDRWLASLEPCQVAANNYRWPQISDVYNKLAPNLQLQAEIISDYQNPGEVGNGLSADADGDGVADSRWVVIPDVNSSKGKPIYAAIRIIDNGGMMNVNTAYKFDPNGPRGVIDGSSQLQINLMALAGRPGDPPTVSEEANLRAARANYGVGVNPLDLRAYEENVIWRYGTPNGLYTPFDISDELELRYRFLLNHTGIDTRLEGWGGEFRKATSSTPFESKTEWFKSAYDSGSLDPNYAYRHIATTYNMDRIIDPNGGRMLNINTASAQALHSVLKGIIDPSLAAQLAVNIVDFRDDNNDVNSFDPDPPGGQIYYGFERPCIYISELDYNQVTITTGSPPTPTIHTSYAVELYKPYSEDSIPRLGRFGTWRLVVDGAAIDIDRDSLPPGKTFCVVQNQDPDASISVDANAVKKDWNQLSFAANSKIELQRMVLDPNGASKYIAVDSIWVPKLLVTGQGLRSFQRDITKHKCIRRLWDPGDPAARTPILGSINSYVDNSRPELIQARPANRSFTNTGEIGMIFRMSAYSQGPNPIGPIDNEFTARLNLINPAFQQIFNYLTVIDPADHGQPLEEKRIKGRININTAPWFVIAQLPWMRYNAGVDEYSRAKAIARYRDTIGGFKNTAELMQVSNMQSLGSDGLDNLNSDIPKGPDLTDDTARNDFEERDLIFARISNLVTVRSDVFTAYILVRIGPNGPQRRVVAILDRSQVHSHDGKVKIIAIQPVPDPR